jgi:UDP-2,4-diacetamido-2,4,6-trideoxy-beta-L-altropyranose hydrolase
MNLYIRADANSKIGIGHIMRCLALAQNWYDQGGKVIFISHCENELLLQKIHHEGFMFAPLDYACPDPDDLKSTIEIFRKSSNAGQKDWFVLDGYHFTTDYQKAIYDTGQSLLVIDDMNHLDHYYADIIVNQNNNAQMQTYNCPEDTILLKGTSYVFLRREFQEYRNIKRTIPKYVRKILVSLGGADPDNVTLKVIQALHLLGELEIEITIVVGPTNANKEQLQSTLESYELNYNLLISPPNMVDLMADSDLAISAGGGTYWELAYMGVPCIMIILAENQRAVAEELGKSGIVCNLGWHNSLTAEEIAQSVYSLVVSYQTRYDMFNKGKAIIDGCGVELTVRTMKSYKRSVGILQ